VTNRNQQYTNTGNDKKPKYSQNDYIKKIHIELTDIVFGLFTAILLGIGGILAVDALYRWPGAFFFAAGIISAACGIYLHVRHRVLNKRIPALRVLLAFCASITCLITLAISQWWFIATKDSEIFNAIVPTVLYGPRLPFLSAAFLPAETVLRPISHLIYVRVTNRTNQPRRLAGIAIEVADRKSWWPDWLWEPSSWTRLCQVQLHDAPLIVAIDATRARKVGEGNNLENVIADNPLPPFDTVSGWTAWGCPDGKDCPASRIRIGLFDTAGDLSWQTIEEQSVPPNLQDARIQFGPLFDLMSPRSIPSCP
jgi:hypothetical protein